MISNDADALDYYYRSHATSIEGRRNDTLFTTDPMDGFIIRMKSSKSNANIMFDTYLKSTMWNRLEKEFEDSDEFYTDCKDDIGGMDDFIVEDFVQDALF
jgi:hypothetical protein